MVYIQKKGFLYKDLFWWKSTRIVLTDILEEIMVHRKKGFYTSWNLKWSSCFFAFVSKTYPDEKAQELCCPIYGVKSTMKHIFILWLRVL